MNVWYRSWRNCDRKAARQVVAQSSVPVVLISTGNRYREPSGQRYAITHQVGIPFLERPMPEGHWDVRKAMCVNAQAFSTAAFHILFCEAPLNFKKINQSALARLSERSERRGCRKWHHQPCVSLENSQPHPYAITSIAPLCYSAIVQQGKREGKR